MYGIRIELTAIAEFHEPAPYEFYPAIKVNVCELTGTAHEKLSQLIHRCEDVLGGTKYDNESDATIEAKEYLSTNYKAIIQAIISKIGE